MRSQSQGHQQKEISRMLKKTSYYDLLDLKSTANQADIKKSYKKLALKYHPDKNSAGSSKEVFHKISEAYDTLSDPLKRNIYDQRQNSLNKPKTNSNFKNQKFYYYETEKSNNFSNFQKEKAYFEKKFSERFQQTKMDQKARRERQDMKRQNQFKQKQQQFNKAFKQNYAFYNNFNKQDPKNNKNQKKQPSNSSKNQPSNSTNNRKTKQNFHSKQWQQSYKRYQKFCQQKQRTQFGKRTSNRPSFQEYQRDIQKRARLQKQKQKAQKNIRQFKLVIFLIAVYMLFSYFGPSLKGTTIYSMTQSSIHNIPHFTKQLNSPFYVSEQYMQRITQDNQFKIFLDRKIDLIYIKTLSKVCHTMMKKKQSFQQRLIYIRSRKSKQRLQSEVKNLDFSACDKLHIARQKNPDYFRGLFQNQSFNKQFSDQENSEY